MKGKKLTIKERHEKMRKDSKERIKIFKELCAHIERGFSLDCFGPLSDSSIRTFLKEYPNEFIEEELVESMRKAKEMWENIGYRQANGQCVGNSRSWYYNMANRFGWREKLEVQAEHKGSINVNVVNYSTKKQSTDK